MKAFLKRYRFIFGILLGMLISTDIVAFSQAVKEGKTVEYVISDFMDVLATKEEGNF
ncbi:hypothetical protein PEPS_00480 [Persicobacter psychrovividus]|uniref:Uncharacterized protein n=2 Tax=Persicobacter psychrovividus TaxID=387638 RepID=A0ABM7VAR4_9BACT|nr:hypothetical protein PEPS_00480 [Persicobacter psychrovividus]